MAGILNNKERILDFIITKVGKEQAGVGELKIKYATLTDLHTFYEKSGSLEIPDLADDASNRILFEAHSRYQDIVVPELKAGMYLQPFKAGEQTEIAGGGLLLSSSIRQGVSGTYQLSGSNLEEKMGLFLDGLTNNFTDQRIIGTNDEFSFYQDIEISPSSGSFFINSETKYLRAGIGGSGHTNSSNIPSIFSDRRFADFPNFKFLPPKNLPAPGQTLEEASVLGTYPRLNEKPIITIDELEDSLKDKESFTIEFSKTSRDNNLVIQFFEQDTGVIEKLAVVDFGSFEDEDPLSQGKRVLYVGKIKNDSKGANTFLCIFTIVID